MRISEKLFRYRCILAILFVCIVVALNINGSSLACWDYVVELPETGVLTGNPRSVRSDEWACFTPMIFSQSFGNEPWSVFSHIIRGTTTDTAVVYGLPASDFFSVFFRPFLDGFLLLGRERGLAFFWSARTAALWLVWFELFRLITDDDRAISYIGATLTLFAPVVQWWFAINGLVEMLIFGAGAVILTDYFFKGRTIFQKCLCVSGFITCALGYILTFYPAWMIPLFWMFAALEIWVFIRDTPGPQGKALKKSDWIMISAGFAVFILLTATFFQQHADTVKTVLNTAYPGKRVNLGGDAGNRIFWQYGNLTSSFIERNIPGNTCEYAVVLDFFPLGMLLCLTAMIREKKTDAFSICMMAYFLFAAAYGIFGFPELLAKVSLLSHSTAPRTMQVIGFSNLLLLARGLHLLENIGKTWKTIAFAGIFAVASVLLCRIASGEYISLHKAEFLAIVLFVAAAFMLLLKKHPKAATLTVTAVAVCAGAFVNPIQRGDAGIYESQIGKEISEIAEYDPNGLWLVDSMGYPYNNLPILFGAPTLNSTSVYPNLELWRKLDPSGKNEDIYNRYAHISAEIIPEGQGNNCFYEISPDQFAVKVSLKEAKELLKVRYVLSNRNNLEDCNTKNSVPVSLLTSTDRYYIYRIE